MIALFVFVTIGELALAIGLSLLAFSAGRLTGYKAALRTVRFALSTALYNALMEKGKSPL